MVQPLIDGRKAGESSPRQPVIAPDSARSVTLLKQVVGLSEGEIEGFGKNDIKLDGTPLSELSSEIVCDYRFGTNSQEYINGVDEVANEIGVGVELRGDLDWVKLITNTDIDHVGIRLRWGPLQTSHSNGDVSGVSISYQILIAPVGGTYEAVLVTTLSDKTSDSYERYHEFKLPPSDDGWMVKVVRTTPSVQSSLVSDKMYVQAYAEIIKSKFTFPYTSLIYLEYDARSFSNVAKLAVNAKGMIVKVPMNYDPATRQYTGVWNGVFKMAYTNNPAWIYYDIVTQRRYGCGDRIDQSMVDKWSLYRLGQYCDQMVDDGYGGLEPRFTCNVYLQSKERVYDVLNRLTGLFRAINFWNGSQLVVDADIPQDTSYLYTNANVVDGLFEYAGTAATDLYSAVKVAWDNPANGYNTEYEAVSYEHLVKKLGFKTLELDAWGCTSRGQALRAGRWALLAESDTVTFKVGMDGYLAMPGKIIEIQDEFYAGKSVGGRVISVSSSGLEITLDRPVETIAGDTISFNTVLGVVKKFNIASSNGTVVTLTKPVGSSVERMHIWAINSSQLATQKYRILTVKYDGIGEFTISAVEYNPNKYEDIDSNITFDEPPTSIINPIAQVAVKNVTISSNEYVYQGLNTVNLEIKWERAENAVEYLVELKKDDGSWLKLPSTGNNSIVLENVYAGYYIASVTAISAYELKSLPAYSVKTVVLGKQSMPLPPLNPRIVPIQFGVEFYWDFPQGATDTAVSRIIVSYLDPTGAVDDSGFLSYDKAYSDNKIVIQNLSLHTRVWFKVKLIDKLGFESPYTSWISGIPSQDFDKVMDLISGQIEQSDLYDDLSQKIEVGFGASAAAANAQTSADQAATAASTANTVASNAQTAASNAQTTANTTKSTADQAKADITALTTSTNTTATELRDRLTTAENGLTQEKLDRASGDTTVAGQLNTYKSSNDAALAAVQQKAEAATTASTANATALTNLTAAVNTKNRTYHQTTAPTVNRVIGDLWINTTAGKNNEVRRWNGTAWDDLTDPRTAASATALSTLQTTVATIDGKTTANSNNITQLTADLSTLSNTVDAKSDASAVDSLTARVTTAEGSITSQGSRVTSLENTVNHATTGLASKASSSALTAVDNKVTTTNGRIDTTNSNVTTLAGRVSTVEGTVATKAEAAALTALTTRVTNAEGVNTSQGSAITTLENRVNHATTGLASKASSAALSSLDSKVTAIDGRVTANATQLTQLNSSLTTTNGNVTTAQNAANAAATLAGSKGKVLVQTAAPAVADRLAQNLWIDITGNANTPKRWNDSAWVAVTDKVATDAATAAANALSVAQTKADASALTSLTTRVDTIDGMVTAQATQVTSLSTTVGNNTAAIQLQQSSINGINAKATLKVEAGGTIGGVALGNNDGVVDFLIRSNTFAITTPSGVPNDTKYMMTYQADDQTLPNGTVIPKGLKVNDAIIGTINANKIYAESLSAISADLGTIQVGSANIADLAIGTNNIKVNSVTEFNSINVSKTDLKDLSKTVFTESLNFAVAHTGSVYVLITITIIGGVSSNSSFRTKLKVLHTMEDPTPNDWMSYDDVMSSVGLNTVHILSAVKPVLSEETVNLPVGIQIRMNGIGLSSFGSRGYTIKGTLLKGYR